MEGIGILRKKNDFYVRKILFVRQFFVRQRLLERIVTYCIVRLHKLDSLFFICILYHYYYFLFHLKEGDDSSLKIKQGNIFDSFLVDKDLLQFSVNKSCKKWFSQKIFFVRQFIRKMNSFARTVCVAFQLKVFKLKKKKTL
jgi:hypothetical protein